MYIRHMHTHMAECRPTAFFEKCVFRIFIIIIIINATRYWRRQLLKRRHCRVKTQHETVRILFYLFFFHFDM